MPLIPNKINLRQCFIVDWMPPLWLFFRKIHCFCHPTQILICLGLSPSPLGEASNLDHPSLGTRKIFNFHSLISDSWLRRSSSLCRASRIRSAAPSNHGIALAVTKPVFFVLLQGNRVSPNPECTHSQMNRYLGRRFALV